MIAEVAKLPVLAVWANRISLALLLLWLGYAALGTNLFGSRPFPESVVDYRIQYEESRSMVGDGRYHVNRMFPYPPSAVALFSLTAWPNYSTAAGMQLVLVLAAAIGTFAILTSLVGLRGHPFRWAIALAALALLNYSVVWDLRSLNCNMLLCFLVAVSLVMLQRERDHWAGFFLAASIGLKLFPVLLIPYLLWIGKRRAFVFAVLYLFLFLVLLPLLVFRGNIIDVYASWLDVIRHIHDSDLSRHPILVSIPFTLRYRTGLNAGLVTWLTTILGLIFVVTSVFAFTLGRRSQTRPIDGWNLVVDAGILVLTPIVLNFYLEPYHLVLGLPVAIAVLQRFSMPHRWKRPALIVAAAALVGGYLAVFLTGPAGVRGLGLYIQMLLLLVAVISCRGFRRSEFAESQ